MSDLSGTPDDILAVIAKNLGTKDLNSLGAVNKTLNKVAADVSKYDTFQAEKKDAEKLFESRKDILAALDSLVEDRISVKKSKKDTSKSGNYDKLKANVDKLIVIKLKELKSLGDDLLVRSKEFWAARSDLQTKIKDHEKDDEGEFKKNVGMTPKQADEAYDWLYKVSGNFNVYAMAIKTRYEKLSKLGKQIKKGLDD